MTIRKEQIKTALAHVLHPEKKMDIISLDMIQDIIVQEKYVSFTLEMPSKNDPLAQDLSQRCEGAIHKFIDRDAVVDIQIGINVSQQRQILPPAPEPTASPLSGVKKYYCGSIWKRGRR